MNGMADIYLITNLINSKQYVGQTVKDYITRYKEHCQYAKTNMIKSPQLIDSKIKEYGVDNFKVELLDTVPISEKDQKEIYYISKYDTYNNGYNQTLGGDFNPMFDETIRKKHKKIMESSEHRKQVSKSIRKRNQDPKIREWYRQNTLNRWYNVWNEEQRNNCISGFINYNNSKKIKIAIIDEDGNIIQKFDSASDACEYCNRPRKESGNLLAACDKINKNGKRAKHFGYYWIKL